jgi:hypothetical protein
MTPFGYGSSRPIEVIATFGREVPLICDVGLWRPKIETSALDSSTVGDAENRQHWPQERTGFGGWLLHRLHIAN